MPIKKLKVNSSQFTVVTEAIADWGIASHQTPSHASTGRAGSDSHFVEATVVWCGVWYPSYVARALCFKESSTVSSLAPSLTRNGVYHHTSLHVRTHAGCYLLSSWLVVCLVCGLVYQRSARGLPDNVREYVWQLLQLLLLKLYGSLRSP